VKNNSGDVEISATIGGDLSVDCEMGSVAVETGQPAGDFKCDFDTDMGSVRVNGAKQGDGAYKSAPAGASHTLTIRNSVGDIEASFV